MSSATHCIIPQDKYHLCPPMQQSELNRLEEYPFKVSADAMRCSDLLHMHCAAGGHD